MATLNEAPSFHRVITATQAMAAAQRRGDQGAATRAAAERAEAIACCQEELARREAFVAPATELPRMEALEPVPTSVSDNPPEKKLKKVISSEDSSQKVDSVPAPTDRRKPYEPSKLVKNPVSKPTKPAKPAKPTTPTKPTKPTAAAKPEPTAKDARRETIKAVVKKRTGGKKPTKPRKPKAKK